MAAEKPLKDQDLVYRLRKRAEIRRQISTRKSVQEGKADRIADLLEEAANEIDELRKPVRKCGATQIGAVCERPKGHDVDSALANTMASAHSGFLPDGRRYSWLSDPNEQVYD